MEVSKQDIIIKGAREGNLQDVTLAIPRGKMTVFTGLSGSGKTTLAMDVLFQECQRQYLEAIGLQGIRRPKVEAVRNVSPAILITQNDANRNPRSTVGTRTDIYTDLRMVFEKLGVRDCPNCLETISAAECREDTERVGDDFKVYMTCNRCGFRMDKLTRTHFSYNTREGACPVCEGLGKTLALRAERAVDESKPLEAGAVDFWEGAYQDYMIDSLHAAFRHYDVPAQPGMPVAAFSPAQKLILYQGVESAAVKEAFPALPPPRTVAGGRFEGVCTILWRRLSERGGEAKGLDGYFDDTVCPECQGERLAPAGRRVTVAGTRLPELSVLSLDELQDWVRTLENTSPGRASELVELYLTDLKTKIERIRKVGLGYLSLDRQTITLSGGELQRLKLAAALDSDLTGLIYIMDEPTIGLHPQDTEGMIAILHRLRDLGNTVIVIEHDPDMMQAADHIVDIGPGSGRHGGRIIGTGTLDELMRQPDSVTGTWLRLREETLRQAMATAPFTVVAQAGAAVPEAEQRPEAVKGPKAAQQPEAAQRPGRRPFRADAGEPVRVAHADLHNLKAIDVAFPPGCLCAVSGISGSGKSTLVFDVLAAAGSRLAARSGAAEAGHSGAAEARRPGKPDSEAGRPVSQESETGRPVPQDSGAGLPVPSNTVSGLDQFEQVVTIEQSAIARMKRSNVATYSDAYSGIRKVFGGLADAKARGLSAKHFSFNTPGGRCENCEGLGFIISNMLFFQDIEVTCPVCGGKQFSDEVVAVRYQGRSIHDVLKLPVEEARELFHGHARIVRTLKLLEDVGLGYLELGQSLTTLSGGEGQRLKLARELIGSGSKRSLYLMDEPTTGLHPVDVAHFLVLLDRMVDAGNTVVVVEHNQQLIRAADWIIDLGPGGGRDGGQVVFAGTPADMLACGTSATAEYLRRSEKA